jgi:hypothetical protein
MIFSPFFQPTFPLNSISTKIILCEHKQLHPISIRQAGKNRIIKTVKRKKLYQNRMENLPA